MRDILFRGKRMYNGELVNGYYCHLGPVGQEKHCIIPEYASVLCAFEVDPATVDQYTGLKDKNGKRIFEGDVVRFTERRLGGEDVPVVEAVEFSEGGFATHRYFLNNWLRNAVKGNCQLEDIEVIGNVHDSPDLLKEEDK